MKSVWPMRWDGREKDNLGQWGMDARALLERTVAGFHKPFHSIVMATLGDTAHPAVASRSELSTLQYLIERATDRVFFHFDMGLKGVFQLPQMGNDNNFRKVVLNRFDDFDEAFEPFSILRPEAFIDHQCA